MVASKGDLVVSYEGKTLIVWDMKAGAQKATFTADKVRVYRKHSVVVSKMLKGGVHGFAHIHESKYTFSPLLATTLGSLFNFIRCL